MLEKLRTKRILGAVGLVAVVLGTMLPYYQYTLFGYSYKIALWNYLEGKVILALTIANMLFIFKDLVEKYAPQVFDKGIGKKIKNANPKFSIVPIILVVAFVVILYVRLDTDGILDHGLGFYSLWIGIVALVLHAFLYKGGVPEVAPAASNVTIIENNNPVGNVNVVNNTPVQNGQMNYGQNPEMNMQQPMMNQPMPQQQPTMMNQSQVIPDPVMMNQPQVQPMNQGMEQPAVMNPTPINNMVPPTVNDNVSSVDQSNFQP